MYREPRITPLEVLREVFWERQPRMINLPLGLRLGFNAWGERRFWIILSNPPINLTCQCGAKEQIGGRVFAKIPFSRRYKEELYG